MQVGKSCALAGRRSARCRSHARCADPCRKSACRPSAVRTASLVQWRAAGQYASRVMRFRRRDYQEAEVHGGGMHPQGRGVGSWWGYLRWPQRAHALQRTYADRIGQVRHRLEGRRPAGTLCHASSTRDAPGQCACINLLSFLAYLGT